MPDDSGISLLIAFTHFLGLEEHDAAALMDYEKRGKAFHSEILYNVGDTVFTSGTEADGFFVVLSGSVVIWMDDSKTQAGLKQIKRRNVLESDQISRVLSPGTIFASLIMSLRNQAHSLLLLGKTRWWQNATDLG